jgi:protein transport protein YIF1
VVNKLFLVLFPWRHKPWSRKQSIGPNGQEGWFLPPRDDLNSPDMYIPMMALVTYILLSTMMAGLQGAFNPELLGYTATYAFFVVGIEILLLKFGCYLLSISNDSQLLDLVAYSGYKFVGVIATVLVSEISNGGKGTGGWIGWTIFSYTFLANALFLVRNCGALLLGQILTVLLVAFLKICPTARKLQRRARYHANCCTITKESKNAISLLILIPSAAPVHVDPHTDLIFA